LYDKEIKDFMEAVKQQMYQPRPDRKGSSDRLLDSFIHWARRLSDIRHLCIYTVGHKNVALYFCPHLCQLL